MPHDPTLLGAYWSLRALAEDLIDGTTAIDRRRVSAAIAIWLLGHCATCGVLLDRERRRRRAAEPLCVVCEASLIPPPPLSPGSQEDDGDVPF